VIYDCNPWIPGISDAEAAYAAKPSGAGMRFSQLDIKHVLDASVLDRIYTQDEIDHLYAQAHIRFGDRKSVYWE
jgi:hypothetical protein